VFSDASRPLRTLVPLDGTAHAKAALEPAANLGAALSTSAPAALQQRWVMGSITEHILLSSKLQDYSFSILFCNNLKGFFGFPIHIWIGLTLFAIRQHFHNPVASHIKIEFGILICG
jgi:hypothetical protein